MCRPQGETLQEVEGSKRLHIAQQMPLPLTISCSSKSRLVLRTCLVLPFWYLLTRVVQDIFQKSSKTVVCVCAYLHFNTLFLRQIWDSGLARTLQFFLHLFWSSTCRGK